MNRAIRLDRLVGRQVHAIDGRRVGRLEEFRAVHRNGSWVVTEYVIGVSGLMERLGLGTRAIVGRTGRRGYVARWDQMDLADPEHPRLRCLVDALEPAA